MVLVFLRASAPSLAAAGVERLVTCMQPVNLMPLDYYVFARGISAIPMNTQAIHPIIYPAPALHCVMTSC